MGGRVGLRVGFININDMYNNDVGKGGVRVPSDQILINGGEHGNWGFVYYFLWFS
jgi:hypothetical protein